VLVSCADADHPERRNLVTVAWAGTVNTDPPMVSISLRPSRYSHGLIASSGEFVINLVDEALCRATDFCGVRSGRDADKAGAMKLAYRKAEKMKTAPAVEGAPVSLSCRVAQRMELGSHDLFLGEVLAVEVREDLMDDQGAIHLERAGLVAYNHGLYQSLGPVLGFFGYSVARPEVFSRRMAGLGLPRWELKSARYLARDILRSVLRPGDRAIDATMGNGHDTEMLCSIVGPAGRVYAFDVQAAALEKTRERLARAGLSEGAELFPVGHEQMKAMVHEPVQAVVFNLGWLPGGDHGITTRTETTLSAVRQALELLAPWGVLVICVYPGHAEGKRELLALEECLTALPPRMYNVLLQRFPNAGPGAPACFAVQRQA